MVLLIADVVVEIDRADEPRFLRVFLVQRAPHVQVGVGRADRVEPAVAQRAGAEPHEKARVDGRLRPQPIRVVAKVAHRDAPIRAELPFDRDVPVLYPRRVDVGVHRAEGAKRGIRRVAIGDDWMRIAAHMPVRIVHASRRIGDERPVAERRRRRIDLVIIARHKVV